MRNVGGINHDLIRCLKGLDLIFSAPFSPLPPSQAVRYEDLDRGKQDGKPIKWTCGRDMAKYVLP